MFCRSSIACALLVVFVALDVACGSESEQEVARDIKVVTNIGDFVKSHPSVRLTPLAKEYGKARTLSVRYTLGGHVSGDRLVAQGADVYSYPAQKDVTIQLTYPEVGSGSVVTYVEIECKQDNYDGNAYVVAGGIGQRFISIVVEANQTENFSYTAQFYGTE